MQYTGGNRHFQAENRKIERVYPQVELNFYLCFVYTLHFPQIGLESHDNFDFEQHSQVNSIKVDTHPKTSQ